MRNDAASPCRGKLRRVFRRAVWVVVTDYNHAPKREALSGRLGEAACLRGKVGAIGVGSCNRERCLDWRVRFGRPMRHRQAGKAMCDQHNVRPSKLYGLINPRDLLRTNGVVPIALLDADEFRM
jgi:hypothetical protein